MEKKACLGIEIKNADKGEIEAVFSTFDVVDLDGDVTLPDAFEDGAKVLISAYGHSSWHGELPAGSGIIKATEKDARLVGNFWMDTHQGRETFHTVKNAADLQEFSYGYDILKQATPKSDDWKDEWTEIGARRALTKLIVHEVSPVLKGAGIGTETVTIKAAKEETIKEPYKLRCMNCSYFIGEASSLHFYVGKARSHREAEEVASLPRDIRLCKGCGTFNVYIPESALTLSGK